MSRGDTSLPFDQYQRYRLVADLIDRVRRPDGELRILDIGGRTGLLRKFLPNDRVDLVDLESSDLEGLVLGVRAGCKIDAAGSASAGRAGSGLRTRSEGGASTPTNAPSVSLNLQDITYSMKSLMWRHMGVQRTGAGLAEAKEKLAFWANVVQDLAPKDARSFELLNMLTVAHLATTSALAREESRGVHYRDDFPEQLDDWRCHTLLRAQLEGDRAIGAEPSHEPVGKVSVPTS